MTRDDDSWKDVRGRLQQLKDRLGASQVAREIPCNRTTLFRLLRGECVPTGPTLDCIERLVDDHDLVENRDYRRPR